MNFEYKFSFVSSVVALLFAIFSLVCFIVEKNSFFSEIASLISLFSVSLSIFTSFNLIETTSQKEIREERIDNTLNNRIDSIYRQIDTLNDRIDDVYNDMEKNAGKHKR